MGREERQIAKMGQGSSKRKEQDELIRRRCGRIQTAFTSCSKIHKDTDMGACDGLRRDLEKCWGKIVVPDKAQALTDCILDNSGALSRGRINFCADEVEAMRKALRAQKYVAEAK